MDKYSRFHTSSSYLLVRLEHVAVVVVCTALTLAHLDELSWGRFIATFVLIDLVGYIPGTIAFHRTKDPIHPGYHYAYNLCHSYLTAGAIVLLWAWTDGLEWAMMAFPIHLSGDRGIFGNIYKPSSLPFEPVAPLKER